MSTLTGLWLFPFGILIVPADHLVGEQRERWTFTNQTTAGTI